MPPTPSSGPASPSISEESIGAEDQANDKGAAIDNGNEEIKKGNIKVKTGFLVKFY